MSRDELMIDRYFEEEFNISPRAINLVKEAEKKLRSSFERLEDISQYNQLKVLKALQKNRISDMHFAWNTGYGYDDAGREATERVFADVFGTEAALVRPNIVNGTHALSITLMGILRPKDKLIYCTGGPYDTLEEVIGIRGSGMGSLKEFGVEYSQVELKKDGFIDLEALKEAIDENTKMVSIQRATGYAWRKAISLDEIRSVAKLVHSIDRDIVVMVDNCYGEFLDFLEPTDLGVDVMAGSLIKNPGGGLALTGGYVVGKENLIKSISYRMTCPGIGGECGLTFGQTRTLLQGLFIAPQTVKGALKGAMLCGQVFEDLGFEVCPKPTDNRSDIIQAIKLNKPDAVIDFCQAIQSAAPVDSHVSPMPWDMPGYEDQVIMAAGAFISGSSIELSADAPMREPYIVYYQGGLTYEHAKYGVMKAVSSLIERGHIKL